MPKVENLNVIRRFVDAVINQYWRVNQLANAWASHHWGSDVRKALQKMNVIQDRLTESLGILGEQRPGICEDFFKIR